MQFIPAGHVSLISGNMVVESASKKDKIGVSVGGSNVGRVATVVSVGLSVGTLLQQTSALPQGVPNSASCPL